MNATAHARLALISAAFSLASAVNAAEQPQPPCDMDAGIGRDIDFMNVSRLIVPGANTVTVACKTVWNVELKGEGEGLRLTRARLYRNEVDSDEFKASLVSIERKEGAQWKRLAWAVLPNFIQDDETELRPQMKKVGDTLLLSIARRHRNLYAIKADKAERVPAFEWRENLAVDPALRKDGQALGLDLGTMEGRVALVREAQDRPKGQSAYDIPKIAVAKLQFAEGKLVIVSQSVVDRAKGEDAFVDAILIQEEAIAEERAKLPPDVEPCNLYAWSTDNDPKGLNVRAGPSMSAKTLGIAPAPRKPAGKAKEEHGDGPFRSDFTIIGYKDGWFLVKDIRAPGVSYNASYPKSLPQPYKGRGWVSATLVGASQGETDGRDGLLYDAPHGDARYRAATDEDNKPYGYGSQPRILACSGSWTFVESKSGSRGWTREMCGNYLQGCTE